MPRSTLAPLLLVTMVASARLAAAQQPPAPPDPPAPPVAAPPAPPAAAPAEPVDLFAITGLPKPIDDDSGEAIRVLKEKEAAFADKDPAKRAEATETFRVHRNESYVKPLAALLRDKDVNVAKNAARALYNQPYPKATETLLDFATNPKVEADPDVVASSILALGGAGFGKKGFEKLKERFDDADKPIKTAIMRALAEQKEKKAFSFFVDHMDEPKANTSAANNPPASYWKARFEEWLDYKQYVRRGLKEMTGESFATSKQWKEWAEKEGKKAGFVYRSGN